MNNLKINVLTKNQNAYCWFNSFQLLVLNFIQLDDFAVIFLVF